jgi:hypothetical protein
MAAAVTGGTSPTAGVALPTTPKVPKPAAFRKFLRCFIMIEFSVQ